MMKKLLALAMTLMMILCCVPALAATEGYVDYEHPTLGYTLEYPEAWIVLDSANIESAMTSLQNDPAFAALDLSAAIPQITQLQMTMFIDNYGTNINIVGQDVGQEITAEQFLPMMPMMAAQVTAQLPDAALLDEGSLYEIGDKQYCMLCASYTLNGEALYVFQFYTFSGTTMYLVTLTMNASVGDMDVIEAYSDHMLATLTFPSK